MRALWVSCVCVLWTAAFTLGASAGERLGEAIDGFELQDYRGKHVRLSDFDDKPIVVAAFLGVECPLARQYAPKLQKIADEYADRGVQVVGIDSNRQDSVTKMAHFARTLGVEFPFLKDSGNRVADQFGAERTPEIFVLDKERIVRYRGRVDDQYGFTAGGTYFRPAPLSTDLTNALDELLAGKSVSVATTKADGCRIGRIRDPNPDAPITYSKEISRILADHCVECHRPGEIGPFALQTYEEVVGWAEMIDEVVQDQRMPPWHANPEYGRWANDHRLSDEEKDWIHRWVVEGAPEGDPADLPEPKQFVDGWMIGKPDQIVYVRETPFEVPAEGVVPYQYFTADPGFTEDKWIKAVECRADARSVVHHIIAFVQPPGVTAQIMEGGPANLALLQGTAPGMPPLVLPEGMACFVPAGSKFVFQMHYTTNGVASKDRSAMGLIFADPDEVKQEARTDAAINPFFVIPAGADDHRVDAEYKFWQNTKLVSLMPHMHLRGKSFRYTLQLPDGTEEILLDVPHYDFNWQNMYFFDEPKPVPPGSVLKCVAHFDNSEGNLSNPDPTATVRWGEQTFEEMMIGWFTAANDLGEEGGRNRTTAFLASAGKSPPKPDLQANMATLAAMKSDRDFRRFGRIVSNYVPQVDRVDVCTLDSNDLVFCMVAQAPLFNSKIGNKEFRVPADRSTLAWYLAKGEGKEIVHNDGLKAMQGEDVGRMAQLMRSSFHVPVSLGGRNALVTFWSREDEAFPPLAQELLRNFAKLAAKNAKNPFETASK